VHKNDVAGLMTLARQRVLDAGLAPKKVLEVQGHFGVAGNPYGADLSSVLDSMLHELEQSSDRPSVQNAILYQPGCASIHEYPKSVRAFLRVLSIYGIDDVQVNENSARCCGLPLLWSGDVDGFRAHAERHAARVSKSKTLVVQDPACAHAMRTRYLDVGVQIGVEVLHVSEFLNQRLSEVKTSVLENKPVRTAYAECCSMAQDLGTEARKLIDSLSNNETESLPLVSGRAQDCCGAAGLLPMTSPSTAEAMATSRLLAFSESKAERLVTFSPRCAAHLKRIAPKLDIVDAMELLVSS